jgi:hypothetical protein
MKKLIFIAIATSLVSCSHKYKIHVTEPTEGVKYYSPMQRVKGETDLIYRWNKGVPVGSRSEAMWQINIWKKHNEHVRRAKRKRIYIKVK